MLAKEVNAIPVGTEVVVISPSQKGRSKYETEVSDVRPERTERVTLVDTSKKYLNTQTGWGAYWLRSESALTESNERTAGYKMAKVDTNGELVYAMVKPTNIIAIASDYDAVWKDKLVAEEEARRLAQIARDNYAKEQARRKEIENKVYAQIEDERLAKRDSINKTIEKLLGTNARFRSTVAVDSDGTWSEDGTAFNALVTGYVRMQLLDVERLLELAIEAKFGN